MDSGSRRTLDEVPDRTTTHRRGFLPVYRAPVELRRPGNPTVWVCTPASPPLPGFHRPTVMRGRDHESLVADRESWFGDRGDVGSPTDPDPRRRKRREVNHEGR